MALWVVVFFGGFLVGIVTLAALEAFGALVVLRRLNQRVQLQEVQLSSDGSSAGGFDPHQSLDYCHNKKGTVWVVESDKVPVEQLAEKAPKEQKKKKKKEVIEVTPIRKFAKLKDHSLFLTDSESDGASISFPLIGCSIEAVSATSLPSRKWAKRFPIRVESKTSAIYHASKAIYIYLETSWEKEAWCKALRLASCDGKKNQYPFAKLNEEFHGYLASLNAGYPSFTKPSVGFVAEPIDRANPLDGSQSKVRVFLKKLARKASKTGIETKGVTFSMAKSFYFQEPSSLTSKVPVRSAEEDSTHSTQSNSSRTAIHSLASVAPEVVCDDQLHTDEGTLCWNLLISRLFFDAKKNAYIRSSVQARIQRTLSNMRTPSYIGEVVCSGVDLGNLPPYIHAIRVLPMDMNEVWACEVDFEYSGGMVLDIETRLEIQDQALQKGIIEANSGSSPARDVSSDLLEEFEYLGKKLNLSEGTTSALEQNGEGDTEFDGVKKFPPGSQGPTSVSRWKTILNTVAKQVSQVPLSLSLRVASLRGTLRLQVKPPPSDQLWFSFTVSPDIEFDLETSVGDHKITSGKIAMFLINRFKLSIRESMVLPNCESISIPWMLAEKDDWVPRNVAPFIWLNYESTSKHATAIEAKAFLPEEAQSKTESRTETSANDLVSKHQKPIIEPSRPPNASGLDASASLPSDTKAAMPNSRSLQDLKAPLIAIHEPVDGDHERSKSVSECPSPSRSLVLRERQDPAIEEDDSKPKKVGRRARMLDLGKKMGEKIEEKRRNIEEKSRNIVDKMRNQ